MALDMLEALDRFNQENGTKVQVRIGINSGAVVAGVIGKHKFIYDLWGDAVSTASRMESHGVAARVQLTEATRRLLSEPFLFEERGVVQIKGKGEMRTWFLSGRSKALPQDLAASPAAVDPKQLVSIRHNGKNSTNSLTNNGGRK